MIISADFKPVGLQHNSKVDSEYKPILKEKKEQEWFNSKSSGPT